MQVHLFPSDQLRSQHRRCADATHIFDGLNNFPTHVAHMHLGTFLAQPTPWPITPDVYSKTVAVDLGPSPTLYALALQWLGEDRERRRELEKHGRKKRGAKTVEVCTRVARSSSESLELTMSLAGALGLGDVLQKVHAHFDELADP